MSKISTIFKYLLLGFVVVNCVACAGPSTPFGALSPFSGRLQPGPDKDNVTGGVEIRISPDRQRFHKRADVKVLIKDPKGISPSAQFQVLYNRRDVTDSFKITKPKTKEPREIQLAYKGLHLPAHKVHDVEVLYRRTQGDPRLHRKAMKVPECDYKEPQAVATTLNFDVPSETLRDVEEVSFNHEINPSMLAALAAQESGFNPKAVSSYRAIGLTQVTHIAEKEIIDDVKEWPRYPGIQRYNFAQLKYKILRDQINHNNEWRLDPRLSLEGGAKYFNALEKYWSRKDKQLLVAQSGGNLTRVMLASYNIGPGTVSRAIKRQGKDWLKDREGRTSTKYVNMVTSYCQNFSEGKLE